jgi:hypothetical protein
MVDTVISIAVTFVSVITAWVTLRITVQHHEKSIADHESRINKLEDWRERERGAGRVKRHHTTERILLLGPVPASPVETPGKDE